MLDIITELDVLDNEEELTQTISAVNIEGTSIGQDQKTQITTVVSGQEIKLTREVAQSTSIQIDSGESYLVVLEQDGVMNQVKVNGGGSSVIVIRQSHEKNIINTITFAFLLGCTETIVAYDEATNNFIMKQGKATAGTITVDKNDNCQVVDGIFVVCGQ